MFPASLLDRAAALEALCRGRGLKLAAAESCTGGLIAALLTEIPGSSAAFDRGFVVYSNAAKRDMIGVPEDVLATHGAVSEATARAMALGVLGHSLADIAVSVTGIAGPDGGSAAKPVGLVYLACARRGGSTRAIGASALSRAPPFAWLPSRPRSVFSRARPARIKLVCARRRRRPSPRKRRRIFGTPRRTPNPSGRRAYGCGTRRR